MFDPELAELFGARLNKMFDFYDIRHYQTDIGLELAEIAHEFYETEAHSVEVGRA